MNSPSGDYGADALIVCDSLVRIYQTDDIEVQALQGLDLLVDEGELVAIVGASGSGKSTLLGVLSGLDAPTAGRAWVAGRDLLAMTPSQRLRYRRTTVGFIWQQTARNLLPFLSARENIELPMAIVGVRRAERRQRAAELLDALGLADRADRRPAELSGGEQQRVAIATALGNRPKVLFADEPTGELDRATGDEVFAALRKVNASFGTTVVIVTHDAGVSSQVRRTVAIRDGRTSSEVLRRDAGGPAEEFALIDRVGRMQVPAAYRQALGLRDRVRLELEPDHLVVRPDVREHDPREHDAREDDPR